MKQYTDKEQTAKLIELGFPKPSPKYIHIGGVSYDSNHNYSIGELIEFLESNTDINIWYDGKSHYWYVDFGLRRLAIDKNLIDSLYFACRILKEEGVI